MRPSLQRVIAALAALVLAPPTVFPAVARTCDRPNPVLTRNFPDPDLLKVGTTFYAFATNGQASDGGDANVQVAVSKDLVNWTEPSRLRDALPDLPAWARRGWTWAPEVAARPDGMGYVMYFTARDGRGRPGAVANRQCIGVASSKTMDEPFRPVGDRPLVCPFPHGAIDASTYREDDRLYLLWKVDGNCCTAPTPIYLRELTADGLRFKAKSKTRLIDWSEPWEGRVVEAPMLWKANGRYWLFYSASHWDRAPDGSASTYAIAYAASDRLEGPYEKGGRLLGQSIDGRALDGPGGQDAILGPDGRGWFAYHAWSAGGRSLHLDFLDWQQGKPIIVPRCAPSAIPTPR